MSDPDTVKAGTTKEFIETGGSTKSTNLVQSNINIGGNSLVNTSDEFALLASNFITSGSTEINSRNNISITDGHNSESSSSYLEKLTIDSGIKVGNAYADAAWSFVDAAKALKAVKDAYSKLKKIEGLKKQGMASSKAVKRAKYQLALAYINSGLSNAAAMQAVGNAANAASTSAGTGFYGSVYADITKLKSKTTSESEQSLASNLISGENLMLASNIGDVNITGSNVVANNGNLNISAMFGSLNVEAGESTISQDFKSKSQSLGGSMGNNGFAANIGMSEAGSSFDSTRFSNAQLTAQNGILKINIKKDANLIGANLLAQDVKLNIQGNLTLKSKQNLLEYDSYSTGINVGISGDSSGVGGSSLGFNIGDSYSNRAWVDQISSIVGTKSVEINVGNGEEGTGNTNIVGAMIANATTNANNSLTDHGNLTLNTTSLTYSDLKNFSVSESNNFDVSLSTGLNPENPTASGSLDLNLSMQSNESSSDTKATIGQGNINTSSIITYDANGDAIEAAFTTINDNSILSGLNREINNAETNKRELLNSDFVYGCQTPTPIKISG